MPRRKGALFLPLDVGFPDDDRIVEVGERSSWLYICMLLASKRLGTDGVLSTRQIERLGVPSWQGRLQRLVGVDLVSEVETGVYAVTSWFDHNDPIAVVQERRAKDAERKKARTPSGVGSESVRTPDVEKRREEKRREEKSETLLLDAVERTPVAPQPFDRWWDLYPRKVGKAAARRAYDKAAKTAGHDALLAGVMRYAGDWTRDPAFTAHPQTWLNQGRWEDEGPVRPQSNVLSFGPKVDAGTAILMEAMHRGRAQQPEVGA